MRLVSFILGAVFTTLAVFVLIAFATRTVETLRHGRERPPPPSSDADKE